MKSITVGALNHCTLVVVLAFSLVGVHLSIASLRIKIAVPFYQNQDVFTWASKFGGLLAQWSGKLKQGLGA